MIFIQWEQVIGLKLPLKGQTRRPDFPYELARQLWKYGWHYPDPTYHTRPAPRLSWADHLKAHPITDEYIAEANQILTRYVITLPVQSGRGKKAVARIRITKIRRERLGDISLDDIFAEGIFGVQEYKGWYTYHGGIAHISPLTAYFTLWDSIYGNGAWQRMLEDDMWVLDFERSEG